MKNKSSFKTVLTAKYLVFPKVQIKYALIYTAVALFSMGSATVVQFLFLGQSDQLGLDQSGLEFLKISLVRINLYITVLTCLVTFLLSVLVTHRFLGPTMAIQRSLESFRKENKYKKISIRKSDENKDLVELLNKFFEEKNES